MEQDQGFFGKKGKKKTKHFGADLDQLIIHHEGKAVVTAGRKQINCHPLALVTSFIFFDSEIILAGWFHGSSPHGHQ